MTKELREIFMSCQWGGDCARNNQEKIRLHWGRIKRGYNKGRLKENL